jgi:hypothetical protein
MWNDPEYLESIRGRGLRFLLSDAEARTVGLKVTAVETP